MKDKIKNWVIENDMWLGHGQSSLVDYMEACFSEILSEIGKDLMPAIQDDWVSVDDELPELGAIVLGWFSHEDFSMGGNQYHLYHQICYLKDGIWWDEVSDDDIDWVPTHWKPLPKPPAK